MAFVRTGDYRIFRDVSGTLTAIGHTRDFSRSTEAEEIDVTTKDDTTGDTSTIPGQINRTITISGLWDRTDTLGPDDIEAAITAGTTMAVVITDGVAGTQTLSGSLQWLTIDFTSNGNGINPVEWSATGKFTGTVTYGVES